ncbi:hypothetical protein Tcan_02898 [Toxocara canis]|uniref:Uncharacterized protein n=1 Tax=Toxocara canis TaxID=6265 RepID=A0A0B2VFT5_TOXCA|nr:hypothetical protein Tcan_02898 [Toxocara canis]
MADFATVSTSSIKTSSYQEIIDPRPVCSDDVNFHGQQQPSASTSRSSTARMTTRSSMNSVEAQDIIWRPLNGQKRELASLRGHIEEGEEDPCDMDEETVSCDDAGVIDESGLQSDFSVATEADLPSYPFRIGLSSKGLSGTLIVITEDGKTWRRKRIKRRRDGAITESFCCISCEKLIRWHRVDEKLPVLSFRYYPPDDRVLITDPSVQEHCCGELRTTKKTDMEQLRRRKSVAAKLAGIDPMLVVDTRNVPRCSSSSWEHEGGSSQCSETGAEEEWVEEKEDAHDGSDGVRVNEGQESMGEQSDDGPNPAAAAHRRNLMKRKRMQELQRDEDGYSGEGRVSEQEEVEECGVVDEELNHDMPEGGYPFTTGLSSKGRKGTLIVITEDGKTWRRRNMRKKGSGQVMEYFNCISCEAVKRYLPSGKFPTLSFVYTPSSDTRLLQTDPSTRRHICGNTRSTARTTAEQLVRKRKAVARLAGIRPVHAYESAASEARNIGEAENWDETFLSNVLEEIVTRTPKRPRDRLIRNTASSDSVDAHLAVLKKESAERNMTTAPGQNNYHRLADYSVDGLAPTEHNLQTSSQSGRTNYPPEFPPDLAREIRALVANSNPSGSSGGWQLYTGDGIIVFVRSRYPHNTYSRHERSSAVGTLFITVRRCLITMLLRRRIFDKYS